jgi:intracellular sulfur oxidation DsrE/DsrF family protein
MERPTKEQVDAALVMVDNHVRAFPNSKMSLVTLSAEVAALQAENEQVRSMQAEKAHLMRQLTAARLMLQETTHERVDPNRDPFGGMGT